MIGTTPRISRGQVIGPVNSEDWIAMQELRSDIKDFASRKATKANAMFLWRTQNRYAKYLRKYAPSNPLIEEFRLDR